jgi:hypothetical protein
LALQLLVTFRRLMRFRVTAQRQLIRIQLPISTAAGRGVGEGSPVCFAVQEAGTRQRCRPAAVATAFWGTAASKEPCMSASTIQFTFRAADPGHSASSASCWLGSAGIHRRTRLLAGDGPSGKGWDRKDRKRPWPDGQTATGALVSLGLIRPWTGMWDAGTAGERKWQRRRGLSDNGSRCRSRSA